VLLVKRFKLSPQALPETFSLPPMVQLILPISYLYGTLRNLFSL
jgi:hypothetical protein